MIYDIISSSFQQNQLTLDVALLVGFCSSSIMPRHCCTTWGNVGCRANYKNEEKITTYLLPTDPIEKRRWIDALPHAFKSSEKTAAVCAKHWPPNFATVSKKGSLRPRDPPSLFGDIPKSTGKQTTANKNRCVEERNCSAAARRKLSTENEMAKKVKLDTLSSWDDLLRYCKTLPNGFLIESSSEHIFVS